MLTFLCRSASSFSDCARAWASMRSSCSWAVKVREGWAPVPEVGGSRREAWMAWARASSSFWKKAKECSLGHFYSEDTPRGKMLPHHWAHFSSLCQRSTLSSMAKLFWFWIFPFCGAFPVVRIDARQLLPSLLAGRVMLSQHHEPVACFSVVS